MAHVNTVGKGSGFNALQAARTLVTELGFFPPEELAAGSAHHAVQQLVGAGDTALQGFWRWLDLGIAAFRGCALLCCLWAMLRHCTTEQSIFHHRFGRRERGASAKVSELC